MTRFAKNRFLQDENGATAVEYVLIAAFMGLMLVIAVPPLSNAVSGKLGYLSTSISAIK